MANACIDKSYYINLKKTSLPKINLNLILSNINNNIDFIRKLNSPYKITLDSSFKLENLITHDREAIDYFIADVNVLNIDNILQTILKNIGVCIKLENVIMFENDKKKYYSILMNMYNHLKLNIYQINEVNDLIIKLDEYNICYTDSFIKMFERFRTIRRCSTRIERKL